MAADFCISVKYVGIVPWFMNLFGFILIFALLISSEDAATCPERVDHPPSSTRHAGATVVADPNAPYVPTELPETEAAVDSSTATAPVVTREKDGTNQDVATKVEEPNAAAQSTVTRKDQASNV